MKNCNESKFTRPKNFVTLPTNYAKLIYSPVIHLPFIDLRPNEQSINLRMRKKIKPVKALQPLGSFEEKLRENYVIIDPYSVEQLSTNVTSGRATSYRPYQRAHYQIKTLGPNQSSIYLPKSTPVMGSSSSTTTAVSSSSEEDYLFSEKERSPARPVKKKEGYISPARSVSPIPEMMVDDSMARPLRTKEESNRIYSEIMAHKRTMQLTGRPGAPVNMTDQPFALCLEVREFELCCFLRLQPIQYYLSRETLVKNYQRQGFYKKSAAQKMLRIDVNKTGRIYDFCIENRWLPRDDYDTSVIPFPPLPEGVEQYF